MLRKHKVKLAVENHKDWRADELVALMKHQQRMDRRNPGFWQQHRPAGRPDGSSANPGALRIQYARERHGVEEYADGFLLSEVPLGKGILDLPKMVALCKKHNPSVKFNLEMITRDPWKFRA